VSDWNFPRVSAAGRVLALPARMAMAIMRQTEALDWRTQVRTETESVDRTTLPDLSGERRLAELLEVFELLSRRGIGLRAWAAPFRDDPLAFLLDTMSDGTRIWNARGELIYQNRAAAELRVGGREEVPIELILVNGQRFERRCLRCRLRGTDYVLEIVREVRPL